MPKKVLIIGVDGGTWKVLKPAMEQGYMPFLKSLCETGASGILKSTIPPVTAAAWSTFQTGKNPGKNGAISFYHWDIKQRKKTYSNSNTLPYTIWEIASHYGKKVGVLNVPMTYPPRPVNGYMVTGILSPSVDSQFTYPPELKDELLSALPNYEILNTQKMKNVWSSEFNTVVESFCQALKNRVEASEYMLKKNPLDLFMVHFQATDALQHKLWGYLDETSSIFDQELQQYLFKNFYGLLDKYIERITNVFNRENDGEKLTFIVSDHGFQIFDKYFNLGKWLYDEGYFKFEKKYSWFPRLQKILGVFTNRNIRSIMLKHIKSKHIQMFASEGPVSWEDSRVLAVGTAEQGLVYLLGSDSEKLQTESELISKLRSLIEPDSGKCIIEEIYKKDMIFKGDFIDIIPDLIIDPLPNFKMASFYNGNVNLFQKTNPKGKHHPNGIFMACGQHIKRHGHITTDIINMAPTILYSLGLPVIEDMDGQVVSEIFEEDFFNQNPIQKTSVSKIEKVDRNKDKVYSDEDNRRIEERLKGLGYL